ncbi:PREDICTED: vasodilator-stimulated phosphoprotein-like [Calidris pugnax]|uniref:vasodilator-stimulated phosphoprotein-like n=1 Tax=Calidris pugnax TaxID=198806 RepID=UPI00071E0AD6|nr:PREDICTED: vasodilator-stimulated phosphoprotein-like [Calidris pugnax]
MATSRGFCSGLGRTREKQAPGTARGPPSSESSTGSERSARLSKRSPPSHPPPPSGPPGPAGTAPARRLEASRRAAGRSRQRGRFAGARSVSGRYRASAAVSPVASAAPPRRESPRGAAGAGSAKVAGRKMSWLTRGGKSKEKEDVESPPSQEERGVLVQAMLEHGGDPWDRRVVGQEPSLKAAERHWLNYVSSYHPKGEKKCSALQWLLFHLARALQAAVEEKEQCIQNLQNSLQVARNEVLALRCDSSQLSEQAEQLGKLREELRAEAAENARLRRKVQCLGTLLSLGKGLDQRKVAALNRGTHDICLGAERPLWDEVTVYRRDLRNQRADKNLQA